MYLFHYMLESNSSKVHINCDKSWHLKFKFRSVKVHMWEDESILMGQMHLSKRVQTLTIFVLLIQNFSNVYISQNTNMGSIIPHSWPLLPLKTSTLCGRVKWGHLTWHNRELGVSGQFETPMLHFSKKFPWYPVGSWLVWQWK
jgi:hypothetical protein